MKLPGRISAAIEVLGQIARRVPAADALRDWGKAHRFAGSADRHAIGTLVYDCLRRRNSLAHRMQSDAPRALVIAALHEIWQIAVTEIGNALAGEHGPGAPVEAERAALLRPRMDDAPVHVAGDFPEWLAVDFVAAFGGEAAAEGQGLASRAPIDLRANTLRADRDQVIAALARFGAAAGPWSPHAVRIAAPGPDARHINVEAEPAHGLGWFEVQDAASQVASLLTGAASGEAVADICAGAGGKTLAMAAMMENRGTLLAHDADRHRLRPIFERLRRAGATNVEVIAAGDMAQLDARGPFDCVVVDAPCSGSGAWRRKPDAKWRLSEKQLAVRLKEQASLLSEAAKLVRPGGRLVYVTCSVLPRENGAQVDSFLARHTSFAIRRYEEQWRWGDMPVSAGGPAGTLLMTPARHGTDGFFVAVLGRQTT